MTADLCGSSVEPYGRELLAKRLDPERQAFKSWECAVAEDVESRSAIGFVIFVHHRCGCARTGGGRRRAKADYLDLFFVAVQKRYRTRGIGTRLIQHVVDACNERVGCQEVRLHVLDGNANAIRLYERLGFTKCCLKKDYPQEPFRAWRMRRQRTGP
ncbi:hypothetical protein PBRA_001469 [Plasmodiophora brassicae]|uniref:N-acetyltransferase domain-containing protein n=1 Tax=Plasmodiophora brassicae TaxID=37360 RepID=A0A0G4IYJ8_PLABS|nr:hypothetical protein PBRA_001469 [Plasmodiophora brassicae]